MLARDRERFAAVRSRDGETAARRGRARGRELRHRPPGGRARARLRRRRRELDRRRLQPRLRARLPRAPPRPARRTCRASAPRSCCGRARSSASAEVSDAWASGSSIMPQKKNPDAAELLRAKAPRIAGHLVALHGVMHALPLTYNKDMQEDKEHLFDAVDTLELCLAAATRDDRGDRASTASGWRAAASDELLAATDVADLLVRRGVPFRECARRRRRARQARRRQRPHARPSCARGARPSTPSCSTTSTTRVLAASSWLESKDSEGGTRLRRVREQLERARALLGSSPVQPASRRRHAPALLRPAGARGRARPRRLRRRARAAPAA